MAAYLTPQAAPADPGVSSNAGVPTGGFLHPSAAGHAANGTKIEMAGGNLGNNAGPGSNFLIQGDEEDLTGRFMMVWQNDNPNHPHDLFSVRRDGFTNAQGLMVVQGNYSSGQPNYRYYYQNFAKRNSVPATDYAILSVFCDVPSAVVPIVSYWGLTNALYAGTRPPIYQHYGSTFINATLYNSTIGLSPMDGTMLESMEDNGNHFSNQTVRTTAAYTNATTSLANITGLGVPVMNGRTYTFTAQLYITSGTGGVKVAIASTGTASSVIYQATVVHNAGTPAITSSGQATSLASAVAGANTSLASTALCTITGTVTMSSGGSTTLAATTSAGSATVTMASTTGLSVGMMVTQVGTGADAIPGGAFIIAIVVNTSITLDRNATRAYTGNLNFWDTLNVQAASNTTGTLTIAQGSSLQLDGSINIGAY